MGRSIGYRMFGSLTEADGAVQETWLRLSRSNASHSHRGPRGLAGQGSLFAEALIRIPFASLATYSAARVIAASQP
jgi:hypothetical protein